jgi:CRP-like cAMP-binding protein
MSSIPATILQLRDVAPFSSCSDTELIFIGNRTYDLSARPGDTLARHGSDGREWVLIVSGTASVTIDGVIVARLGPGESVGEMALIDRGVRTATVLAETEITAVVASRSEFEQILHEVPAVMFWLLATVVRRLRAANDLLWTAPE